VWCADVGQTTYRHIHNCSPPIQRRRHHHRSSSSSSLSSSSSCERYLPILQRRELLDRGAEICAEDRQHTPPQTYRPPTTVDFDSHRHATIDVHGGARTQYGCWFGEAPPARFPSSLAEENHYDVAGYASEEVHNILTTRRPNRVGAPPVGMPCSMAAGSRPPGCNPGASSAGVVYETGFASQVIVLGQG